MANFQTTFTTTTPAPVAFDYLSRFSSAEEWDPGVVEAHDLTPGPVEVGSAFHVVSRFAGRQVPLRYEVVELDRPHRVVLRAENSSVTSIDTITVVDDGRTTSVTYDAELRPRGLARLFGPVLAMAFRRIGEQAAPSLRAAVDRLGSEGPAGDETNEAR